MEFIEWLQNEKKYQKRTSHDVACRLRRVRHFLGTEDEPIAALQSIENNKDFIKLTCSVKSQLRKSLRLYDEYQKSNRN